MDCPQCHSDEISPSGICLICGYQIAAGTAETSTPEAANVSPEAPSYAGMIEMDYSGAVAESPEKNEVPEWRQQLSQRLHEIKQKRDADLAVRPENKPAPPPVPPASASESLMALQAKLAQKAPVRKPRIPSVPAPQQKTLQPLESPPAAKAEPVTSSPANPQEIRKLIDNAVARQAPQSGPSPVIYESFSSEAASNGEDKLILLSRTLSGLVDLIVVILCTGAFIFAADYFSGILSLDNFSLALFFVVFLLNYFVYSLFFLSSSNQTIGMMITELRVVSTGETRPSIGQILRRCCGYLVSFFGLGIGLLLGVFDRGSRCFHDRISGTHVVRI